MSLQRRHVSIVILSQTTMFSWQLSHLVGTAENLEWYRGEKEMWGASQQWCYSGYIQCFYGTQGWVSPMSEYGADGTLIQQ